MRTTIRTLVGLAAVGAIALTTGCGTAGDKAGGEKKTDTAASAGAISVKHTRGTATLKAPAKKVVALEWTYAEDLLALGVTPAGVADVKGYGQWVTAGPRFDDSVKDVGTRQAPSLETIKALKPDLIITSKIRSDANYAQLEKIAPTLMFDPYAGGGEYKEMRDTLKTIGTAVGKEKEADKALADLDGKIAAAKKKVTDAKKEGSEVTVARGYSTNGAAVVEILTDSTIPGALLPDLGLKNAWTKKADAYGMAKVDVEGLKPVEKSTLVYVAAKKDDPFATSLPKNELWNDLDFVKNDRVKALDPGTWYFGGPFSAAQTADQIAGALSS
ncbi:ABC transporter substrate-binding protein [Streptomyces sp. URMC 123]|uniref:ABC transporter substrate-binding protein n=1 Tax=Streptomyces sp. URMC 123 TaxID=3423403 RepID=UPI003F193E3F